MRKIYNFIYLINLIVGFLLFYNFLFVYETIEKYNTHNQILNNNLKKTGSFFANLI